MNINKIEIFDLETHETKDIKNSSINGNLTPIWRDWDKIIPDPKMIYITNVIKGGRKGPHVHKKRTSCFVCIKGKVVFIIKEDSGNYLEIESSEDNPVLVEIPKNHSSAHINLSNEPSIIMALVNPSWKPDNRDEHNVTYDDYDWTKWDKYM